LGLRRAFFLGIPTALPRRQETPQLRMSSFHFTGDPSPSSRSLGPRLAFSRPSRLSCLRAIGHPPLLAQDKRKPTNGQARHTHHSPLTTHHSPLTTHHSPPPTHHSPLTTHHVCPGPSPLTPLLAAPNRKSPKSKSPRVAHAPTPGQPNHSTELLPALVLMIWTKNPSEVQKYTGCQKCGNSSWEPAYANEPTIQLEVAQRLPIVLRGKRGAQKRGIDPGSGPTHHAARRCAVSPASMDCRSAWICACPT
jgi:hypothetical protein